MKKYGLLPNGKKNLKPKFIKPKIKDDESYRTKNWQLCRICKRYV